MVYLHGPFSPSPTEGLTRGYLVNRNFFMNLPRRDRNVYVQQERRSFYEEGFERVQKLMIFLGMYDK